MIEKILNNKLKAIGVHILIGFLVTFSGVPKLYGAMTLILPIFFIFYSRNKNEEALLFSFYIVGSEVFVRMTHGFFLYETGKYSVCIFLFIGMFLNSNKQKFSFTFIFYILLLLLGIVFTELPPGESIRKAIAFNLSGPIVLGVSGMYLYNRNIREGQLLDSMFFGVLPLFSMVTYLYFRTPDLKEIVFGGAANFDTSGGFGPNQVATAIGLGIFIIAVFILLRKKLSGFLILDICFLGYFVYRGLLTFSRGGVLTGVFAFMAISFFYILSRKDALLVLFKYLIVGGVFSAVLWGYTSNATNGMLSNRYEGKNASGIAKKDVSSGRIKIIRLQLNSFLDNPLGIGVGNGKYKRELSSEHVAAASHNELGRIIEEHGLIGIILLLMLLVIPLIKSFNSNNYQRGFLISFYLIWFLTINHSAMRIALAGFIYGLSIINITEDEEG